MRSRSGPDQKTVKRHTGKLDAKGRGAGAFAD